MGTDERKGRAVSHRGPHPVRRRKDRVVIGIVLSLALLLFNVGLSFIFTSRLANRMEAVKGREVELFDAAWQVRYLDEVLTHSASEYVLSGGDTKWRTRYDQYVVELDRVLADLRQRGDRKIVGKLDEVNAANNALVALETRVFQEADNRDFAAATRLLSGPYVEQKAMYRKGLDAFFAAQRQRFDGIVQKAKDGVRLLRILTVVSSAVLFGALLVLGQVHRRQADLIDRRDREQADEFAKQSFEQRLARTLEMAQTEDQTLESVSNVFDAELTTGVAEFLLADSSHAHLRRVAGSTLRTDRPGCGVASPYECPAIRLGTTLHFEDPASYESCPALRSRGLSGCSAICVPVSVTGLTVGVIHTLVDGNGANQSSVDSADRIADRVSARVGERIGVIRAFEKSQIQAATDPLTGLLNRRSIEARAVEMMRIGGSLSVMYLDLDHFKRVNDTLGHDAGDRALRRFSKVLRDSTRSSDIVGRWGGEEFLVVSPDDGIATNRLLFDRIREGLLHAAVAGEGPSLTVSAGVATSLTGDTFTSLIGRADSALLQAKQDGRDQLVVSVGANRPSRT